MGRRPKFGIDDNGYNKRHIHRKYNKAWEESHKWLTLKDGYCYCKLCSSKISAFKKHNLVTHEKSVKHRKRVKLHENLQITEHGRSILIEANELLEFGDVNGNDEEINEHETYIRNPKSEPSEEQEVDDIEINEGFCDIERPDNTTVVYNEKIQTADGSYIIIKSTEGVFDHIGNTLDSTINYIIRNVSRNFEDDLRSFLHKNESLVKSINKNKDFSSGETGKRRLTRLMVGHVAQQYLMGYAVDSWKSGEKDMKGRLSSRLDAIEQSMEQSVKEVRFIKSELNPMESLTESRIVLEEVNIEL